MTGTRVKSFLFFFTVIALLGQVVSASLLPYVLALLSKHYLDTGEKTLELNCYKSGTRDPLKVQFL